MDVTFITGNQHKADFLAQYLGHPVAHQKIELDEIQTLDLQEVSENKARQAYATVQKPVLVEDISLEFMALGKLPGTFVRWFIEEIGTQGLCKMLKGYEDRSAIAKSCFVYFDGMRLEFFEGSITGQIASEPRGAGGFGWDAVFIPDGAEKTLAEMNDQEIKQFSLRTTTVFPQLKKFLSST